MTASQPAPEPQRLPVSPAFALAASAVGVLLVGLLDWATGWELQFFVFYFIPIAFAAWFARAPGSYFVVLLSAAAWFTADALTGHPYTHQVYAVWNTFIRLVAFLALGVTLTRIRSLLDAERRISADLEKALSEVKTLTGLLPICATCKKIRNDQGYWQRIEEYLSKHTDARFSHGYCAECAAKALQEAGIDRSAAEARPASQA